MKAKLTHLQNTLSQGMIGREEIIKSALLALVAGEHIVLVGPPGTGKSMVARRMADALAGDKNTYFEYLLTKFSTPEELFGALSISELKQDRFVRKTDGFLPTAQVAFLDEIFKASSSILNALLTILNERKFHNGTTTQDVPLQSLISASNELPNGQSELSALYDRFLIRRLVDYVGDENLFKFFELGDYTAPTDDQKLTQKDLDNIRIQAKSVTVPTEIQTVLKNIWQAHNALFKEDNEEFLSDRKFYKVVNLLKVSAHTNERTVVDYSDVLLLKDCLWNNYSDDKIAKVRNLISQEIQKASNMAIKNTTAHSSPKGTVVKYLKGSGTADDPFLIENKDDLSILRRADVATQGYYFLQTADIDISNIDIWSPIPIFKGHYHGNGYHIKFKKSSARLFTDITDSTIEQIEVTGLLLAENVKNSVIENCKFNIDYELERRTQDFFILASTDDVGLITLCENSQIEKLTLTGMLSDDNWATSQAFGIANETTKKSKITDCVIDITANINRSNAGFFDGISAFTAATAALTATNAASVIAGANKGINKACAVITNNLERDSVLENNINLNPHSTRQINSTMTCGTHISADLLDQSYYADQLQYDFDNIWDWDKNKEQPVLQKGMMTEQAETETDDNLLTQQLNNNIWL